jgi:hypothetical protein
MSLAAPTVYVAVDQALLADAGYMAVAVDRGVYAAGDVPDNQRLTDSDTAPTKFGYAEIGSSNENADDQFATAGADGVLTLTVRAISKRWALILAGHIHRVCHGTTLPGGLSVFTAGSQALVSGEVQFVEDFADPDGGHSAVLQYRAFTVSTA